jgi:hypothetical protein
MRVHREHQERNGGEVLQQGGAGGRELCHPTRPHALPVQCREAQTRDTRRHPSKELPGGRQDHQAPQVQEPERIAWPWWSLSCMVEAPQFTVAYIPCLHQDKLTLWQRIRVHAMAVTRKNKMEITQKAKNSNNRLITLECIHKQILGAINGAELLSK